jgi:radical SAM protein with 4Fe4S-binding SPASM domain
MKYLLQRRGFKAFLNFWFVKLFVPAGEGSGQAAYYLLGPLIRHFPQLAPYPPFVEFEITTRCNKRCILCEHTYWKEPTEDLTFDEFKRIVDQFPTLRWVNLTGEGDAFLNKDYLRMIRYLKEKEVQVFLVDSFDLIDETVSKELVDMDVDGIYISMDGATKKTYEKIKVGCDFDKVNRNIRKLIEFKKAKGSPLPEICIRYVVTAFNYNEMSQFVEHVRKNLGSWDELGDGSKIHFIGLLSFPEIKQYYLPVIPKEAVSELMKKSEEIEDGAPVVFAHSEPEKFPSINRCLAWMEPYIMMKGNVIPCCAVLMSNNRRFLKEHCFGNLLEKPFKEIWESERYVQFRHAVNDPKAPVPALCRGCRVYNTREREEKYGISWSL